MHTFNRFLVILVCLTAIIFWALVLLVIWAAPTELGGALVAIGRQLRLQPFLLQALVTGFGACSVLVSLLILTGEFTARNGSTVRVAQSSGGPAEVSLEAIGAALRARLADVEGVLRVRPVVHRASATSVDVRLEVRAAPTALLAALADRLAAEARDTVAQSLGVGLRRLSVLFVEGEFGADGAPALPRGDQEPVVVPSAMQAAQGSPPQEPT